VFVDNSIVEIFANDRFALTSRIYPSLEASIGVSYDFGKFDTQNNVKFQCWEGLAAAWLHRNAYGQQASVELHTKIIDEKMPLQLTEPMLEGDIYA
jgi:beta-fructofuranosidase